MDEKEAARFRELLEQRRDELTALRADGDDAAGAVELDQSRVGRLSRMDALQGQQLAADTQRRRQREHGEIAAAIARIDAGDYGWCEQCGELIDPRRLAIAPTARVCVPCADK